MSISQNSMQMQKETAIKNLGGSTHLYEKYLSRFLQNYTDSPDTISELLHGGSIQEARRLVHSVKGLAGTLGLADLYNAASQLEDAISGSPSYPALELNRYEQVFSTLKVE